MISKYTFVCFTRTERVVSNVRYKSRLRCLDFYFQTTRWGRVKSCCTRRFIFIFSSRPNGGISSRLERRAGSVEIQHGPETHARMWHFDIMTIFFSSGRQTRTDRWRGPKINFPAACNAFPIGNALWHLRLIATGRKTICSHLVFNVVYTRIPTV